MAYAAVVSLKHTIHGLLSSSLGSSARELLESACVEVKSLQQVLKRLDDSSRRNRRLDKLDGEIREAVHKLEASLEFHHSSMLLPEEINGDLELEEVRQEVFSFIEKVKEMGEEYVQELDRKGMPGEEDDFYHDAVLVPSSRDFGVEMVGSLHEISTIKKKLLGVLRPDDFGVFSIVGRAGSGRTVAGRIIFEDLCIRQDKSMDCGAWVNVGSKHEWTELLVIILRQLCDPACSHRGLLSTPPSEEIKTADPVNPDPTQGLGDDEESLVEHLYSRLKDRRYMIVLDDVRDTKVWDYLRRSFPKQDNGSLVLLTTSLLEVALSADSFHISHMPDLNEHPLWEFLYAVMFGRGLCPPELKEVGKKIIENCQKLRLVLPKVLLFLYRTRNTPEQWNNLAADRDNPIFMVADELAEVFRMMADKSIPPAIKLVVSKSINLSRQCIGIKMQMFPKRLHPKMEIFSIFGMAGLGKTTLVKRYIEDPQIIQHFDHYAWITLGPNYRSEEILVDILAKMYVNIDRMHLRENEILVKDLCTKLSNKRCLLVLDDLWSKEPLEYLQQLLPNTKGEIFVTTRLYDVAKCGSSDFFHAMALLNEEESWLLFCRKLFSSELCPFKLEKAGKRICKKCEGLPLLILTVADLLSKVEMSPEYWEEVAEEKNPVFMEAQAQLSNVLSPSYNHLPQHLKACFLFMGVFSLRYEIPTSRLFKLWDAEGFLEPNPSQTVEDFALECLSQLDGKSLVMVSRKGFKVKIKTCRLHFVFWHLSNSVAVKNKFFLSPSIEALNSDEGINGYRRLCIRSGILFSIKDFQDSIMSIPIVHSLLYTGPLHRYPVSISLRSRLVRVLDILMIRFYEFPIELVALIQLTYLALTCNGEMPSSISKLRKLQCLIVSQHLSIKSEDHSPYLPAEIWDMKELNHLQITGGCLRNPASGNSLRKLLTLLEMDAQSCTRKVLKRLPNLKKLGIQIELEPDSNKSKSFRCLNRISRLRRLESLKCIVVNPDLMSEAVPPPAPRSMFPSSLRKLSLSGLGYPWEYMSIVCKLQNLEVLKLRCYAFQGPRWEPNYSCAKLKYLLIEDTDLVCWQLPAFNFLKLEHISFKHCYNIEELPLNMAASVKMVEVEECNSVVMNWAEHVKQKHAWTVYGMPANKKQISCSWDAGENFRG